MIAADRVPPALQEGSGIAYGGSVGSGYGAGIGSGTIGALAAKSSVMLLPGQMGGVILDSSGATIPGVMVAITNPETGFNSSTRTDSDGGWTLSNLTSGKYTIRADAPGFNSTVYNLTYNADRPQSFRFRLNPGAVMDTVEVQAESVDAIAMNGGKIGDRAQLKPGVAQTGAASANVMNLQRRVARCTTDSDRYTSRWHLVQIREAAGSERRDQSDIQLQEQVKL